MKKRILSILLTMCLLLGAVPVSADAASGPRIYVSDVTVTAGNYVTVYLRADNLVNVAAAEVDVYYDATALTLSSTSNGSLLSGAMSSLNKDEPGHIKLTAMTMTGISGSGYLFSMYFRAESTATPGKYPITLALGTFLDTNFKPIAPEGANGSVTVTKPVLTETFSLYRYLNKSTFQKGDLLTFQLTGSTSRPFVTGEFVFTYDYELFQYEDLVLENSLQKTDALWSVNSTVPGQVRVSYAANTPVADYYLMTLKLRVIDNVSKTTTIKAEASNVYREDLAPYLPGSTSASVTLTKLPEVTDYPDIWLETGELIQGQEAQSVLYLEGTSKVAAADITLTYDPNVLSCLQVEAQQGSGGYMLILNDNYKAGTIRFSYVNQAPATETMPLLRIRWMPLASPKTHYSVKISGVGVVDVYQKPVTLEYKTDTDCIYVETVTEPTCAADGTITYDCSCGKSLPTVVVPMEHPWDDGVYTNPTYESDGFTTYTCTNCRKTKTVMAEGTQLQHAAIFRQPEAVTADSGNKAIFHVEAANTAVSFKWEYRKIYKWYSTTMDGYNTDTLTVTATGARNGYDYRCTITFADGTVLVSDPAELTVNTVIDILQNPNDQTVVLGYKGQFTASAAGEGVKYQWQYCRPGSEKWIDTAMEGATKATVYVESTTARDGYQYRCTITDVAGKTVYTEPATMRVLSVKGHPQNAYAPVGGTVYFTVTTSVPDGFTYQWQYSRNGGSSWSNTTMEGYNTATLTVGATKARNGYLYRCVLTGSKNSKIESKPASLCVSDPVVITTHPENVTAATGTVAVFKVTATNVYSYQWQYARKGSDTWQNTSLTGYATDTLSVDVTTSRNGYRYRCLIIGLDGQTYYTDPANLKIG